MIKFRKGLAIGIAVASLFSIALTPIALQAAEFPAHTPYQVCFTPGQNCTQMIVDTINSAQRSILIQAYRFTSADISKAVVNAKKRGVNVEIILDKSQGDKDYYTSARFFKNQGISVLLDTQPKVANNKVIIIDNSTVITGSFDFTRNAQENNADNVLAINNSGLAEAYTKNWLARKDLIQASEKTKNT